MNTTCKRGSISLETAISFSIVLIFITAIISVTVFIRTDILMQGAVSQSCEDLSCYMPFSVVASDSISTLVNALPDGNSDTGMIERVVSIVAGADTITSGGIRAAALNVLLGDRFTDDIATEFYNYNGSYFFGPDEIYADFDIGDYYIEVYVVYSVNTIIGPISREIVSTVPFYGDFELFLGESEAEEADSGSVWQENNFNRGRIFADRYGANLPPTFPVINSVNGGNVSSVVSIDLNRRTYTSPAAVIMRVTEQIEQIAAFRGADVQIDGRRYAVNESEINSRTLIVVIPEDSPDGNIAAVNSLHEYASLRGVELQVIQDGCSL